MPVSSIVFYWLTPWEPSVTVIVITILAAVIYMRGSVRINVPRLQQFYFWLGLLSFYIVLHTRFDYYSEHAFFIHRIQHTVLHHIGPFLIALSRPGRALSTGLFASWKSFVERMQYSQIMQVIADACNNPFMAVILFNGLIIFWLVSPIHFIAMLDWRFYRIMNWGMALNGLMFWNLVLNNYALKPAHLSPASRIGIMLAVIPPQIIIGMVLFFAAHELYPIYTICGRAFAMSALADQQIGGLILWIPAAMMSVIGILIVIEREWLRSRQE